MRHALPILAALLLPACATAPGIPETTYYRLPPRAAVEARAQSLFEKPVVVDRFLADGVHSEQALIYATDPSALQLRTYHYQLWVDPPERMLQRRLIATLRAANLAPLVLDRVDAATEAVRINGRVIAFERVPAVDGWEVLVELALRADAPGADGPLLAKRYRERRRVGGGGVADSAQSFGAAVDAVYARFIADLAARAAAP